MRALLLGGTGAMGAFLQDELVATGWEVCVTSRSTHENRAGVTFIRGNAQDLDFLKKVLNGRFDVLVDFMTGQQDKFGDMLEVVLPSVARYVFLSSYRVFADVPVITEDSPRLLETCSDRRYREGNEYAVRKAREEDMLHASEAGNWIIVRPAITFSGRGFGRFQLCTYEKDLWLWRAMNELPVPVVPEMMEKQCTITWAGDVAKMIACLVNLPEAEGEVFNVSTCQHQTWNEVLELYRTVLPVETCPVTLEQYESHCGPAIKEYGYIPQVRYDRMLNRVLDNAKVLSACGFRESDLSNINEILPQELKHYIEAGPWFTALPTIQGRLDRIAGSTVLPLKAMHTEFGMVGSLKYMIGRLGLG